MGEEQFKEASWVAQRVPGLSAYLYCSRYRQEQARQELEAMVEYIQKSAQE